MSNINPHWIISEKEIIKIDELELTFEKYRKSINYSILFIPKSVEFFGVIRSIKVYLEDLDLSVIRSMWNGLEFQ